MINSSGIAFSDPVLLDPIFKKDMGIEMKVLIWFFQNESFSSFFLKSFVFYTDFFLNAADNLTWFSFADSL